MFGAGPLFFSLDITKKDFERETFLKTGLLNPAFVWDKSPTPYRFFSGLGEKWNLPQPLSPTMQKKNKFQILLSILTKLLNKD